MRHIAALTVAVVLGLAPALALAAPDQARQNSAAQGAQVPAEAPITDGTIGKAGAALHDVADLQRKYQPQMESASSQQKQSLSEKANAEAVQAIQSRGLTVQEYSAVVRTAQNNPHVKQRLLEAANKAQ